MKKKYNLKKNIKYINTNGSLYFINQHLLKVFIEHNNDFLFHNSWKKNRLILEKEQHINQFISKYNFYK
jgi:hypothetical protein